MSRFSERHGYKPAREALELESMGESLRIAIWNVLGLFVWSPASDVTLEVVHSRMKSYVTWLHLEFFNWPIDDVPQYLSDARDNIKSALRKREWYWTYDYIEFTLEHYEEFVGADRDEFVFHMNRILEREGSGYRIVEGRVAPITNVSEIDAVEAALGAEAAGLAPVRAHLRTALAMLADRAEPDYRNSVKESISAVEALVNLLMGGKRATLGKALKKVDPTGGIHPALIEAFSSIYGYTSNADGIRHAMLEEDHVRHEDALYMLVSCSAFVNYVVAKAAKSGVEFGGNA